MGHLSAQTGDGKWAAGVRWKVVKVALRPFSLDRGSRVSVDRERNFEHLFLSGKQKKKYAFTQLERAVCPA